jgi:hypothetical protein
MGKFFGGFTLLVASIYLLRNGGSVDGVLTQAGAALDWLVGLGAGMAQHAVPAVGRP